METPMNESKRPDDVPGSLSRPETARTPKEERTDANRRPEKPSQRSDDDEG